MRRSQSTVLAAVVLLILGITAFVPSMAAADHDPKVGPQHRIPLPPGVTEEQVHNQELLDRAKAPLAHYLRGKGDGEGDPAYARVSVDVERLTMVLQWKGEPPPEIQAMAGTTSSGVKITIVRVPYSQGDISAAAKKIF